MEEIPSNKKNSKKSRINDEESRKNNSNTNNENVYEFKTIYEGKYTGEEE